MKKLALLTLLLCFSYRTYAQNSEREIITTAAPFLLVTSDARAGGMGDIGAATSSDAYSLFHNASKIAFNENQISIGVNYTPWLRNLTDDIFVGNASYINRFQENSAWGVDIKYFSLGKIELTSDLAQSLGYKNPSEFAITGAYALKLSEVFSMGVGLKYINSNLDVSNDLNAINGFAVDVSAYFKSEEKNLGTVNGRYRLGINVANMGPKVSYTPGQENFIPTNVKIGGGFDFIFDNENTAGINLEFTKLLVPSSSQVSKRGWFEGMFTSLGDRKFSAELQETTWALGVEYLYTKAFALRVGYFHESKEKGNRQFFTSGLGFKTQALSVDLSYLINTSIVNNPLENTLRFSLSFDLGEIYEDY